MPGRRRRLASAAGNVGLLVVSAALLIAGPGLVDGHVALQWTRYHAAAEGALHAPDAARWAVRAARSLAPLPQAREAVVLAVQSAARAQASDPRQARAAWQELRGLLPLASGWRGHGLSAALDEIRREGGSQGGDP